MYADIIPFVLPYQLASSPEGSGSTDMDEVIVAKTQLEKKVRFNLLKRDDCLPSSAAMASRGD
jgi:hypothetical protein